MEMHAFLAILALEDFDLALMRAIVRAKESHLSMAANQKDDWNIGEEPKYKQRDGV